MPHSQRSSENSQIAVNDVDADQGRSTQFLVSIRDPAEAALAQAAGVDWIDLKEPRGGALGRADLSVAQAVATQLVNHAQRSAALGELCDLADGFAAEFATLFPYLKVGLSHLASRGAGNATYEWSERFLSLAHEIRLLGSHLVPVIYADYLGCAAPRPSEVLAVAEQARSQFLLIDTYTKDGRSLTDWLSLSELQAIRVAAQAFDCGLVLAGSLQIKHVPLLCGFEPHALAVRGAVCSGDRAKSICPTKVAQWCELLRRHGRPTPTKQLPSTATESFR